ncbi:helix-turn-helix transcriptional regulator [Enterococcus sp. LJL90]
MTVTIGEQLKKIRSEHNLTQAEVAEKLKISRQTLSKWELDKSQPDLHSLRILAAFYKFSVDDLLEVAKERKRMLTVLKKEDFQKELIRVFLNQAEFSTEKNIFVQKNFVEPLMERSEFEELYWIDVERLSTAIGFFSRYVNTEQAKEFLKLFPIYNYNVYWVNQRGIGYFNVIEWLGKEQLHYFPFKKMSSVVFGNISNSKKIQKNSFAFGYRTMTDNYDVVTISSTEKAQLFEKVLTTLDPEGRFFEVLTDQSVLKNFGAW